MGRGALPYWEATAIRGCCCQDVADVVYIDVWVGGVCQVAGPKVSQENIAM